MVDVERGDHGYVRIHHIHGVQPPSHAHLEDGDVGLRGLEYVQGGERPVLEYGQGHILSSGFDRRKCRADSGIIHRNVVQPDAFVVTQQVRRSIGGHLITGSAVDALEHGDRGTLAIGSGNRDDRMARAEHTEARSHGPTAFQTQFDVAAVQGFLPRQPGLQ